MAYKEKFKKRIRNIRQKLDIISKKLNGICLGCNNKIVKHDKNCLHCYYRTYYCHSCNKNHIHVLNYGGKLELKIKDNHPPDFVTNKIRYYT